jgi:DNA repair protein SbcD/Mre11
MRLLHLADIHLDTLFAGRSESLRRRLRDASREAFSRALRLAVDRQVDAVLIAGDLFDGERLSFQTEGFLMEELNALDAEGIPVVYATGNHDPGDGLAGRGRLSWPANVHLFDGPHPRTIPILRGDTVVGTVTGAGHPSAREERDLSAGFPGPDEDGLPHVGLLHTQVVSAGGAAEHDRYAPSTLPGLRESGFDYWALGHIHLRQELSAVPGIHFAGNLQGRNPRESGAKGGLVVDLPARGAPPRVEFVELAPVRWETLEVDGLDEAANLGGLVERVRRRWEVERGRDPGPPGAGWIVRVELSGPSPLHALLRDPSERVTLAEVLSQALEVLEVEVRVGGVRPALDPARYVERQDAAGEALRLARRLAEATTLPQAELSLEGRELAGAPADADDPGVLAAYLRGLLAEGDRTLLERFLEGRPGADGSAP